MATLLDLITTVCERVGLPAPTVVIGNTDPQILQLKGLLTKGIEDMSQRGTWETLNLECLFTTIASEDQGLLTTMAPGYRWTVPGTLWDRTQKIQLLGATDPATWQWLKAIVVTGPRYSFRFRGAHFLVTPAPPAGHQWVFEYQSRFAILDVDGVTVKQFFTADTDSVLISQHCLTADLEWRWKAAKGLPYAEDFNTAERLINNDLGRNLGPEVVSMNNDGADLQPGVFVPKWNPVAP